MSNPWTKALEELITRNANTLQSAITLLGNACQLLHTDPEKAAAECHHAAEKVGEAQGPLSKLVHDARDYQAMYWRARNLLGQLGHKTDEPGYDKRLEETIKALQR